VGYVLVTNDDGIDSPALVPLIRALEPLAPVRAVVPSSERSWISKAISRWDEIRVERVERQGIEIYSLDGFPADCTNLGVHSLFEEPPDMVVSGINIGLNSGLGFFLSSGTVGAATEGWIAGLPAIAFSVGIPRRERDLKGKLTAGGNEALWLRAAALSADVVRDVRDMGFPPGVDLLNVNFPVEAGIATRRVVTHIAEVGYGALFRRESSDVFVHDYAGELRVAASLEGSDIGVVREGWVSITPIRLAHTAELGDPVRRRLEREDS
jgi:5'-nucleotidase